MKKYLFILILLIGKGFATQSQTIDTICFPYKVIQKVLIAAEQKKVLEQQVVVLNLRIAEKDSIIALLRFKEETGEQIIKTYEDEVSVMKDQRKIFENEIKQNEKIIRKLKRKVFWTSAAGLAGVGAMAYLLLIK